jgi:hypothetical protein
MTVGALVDTLAAAGVRLSLAGNDLRYQTQPGVSIAPYREQITEHKLALVTELRLREEIVAAAAAVHARFDRERYDELWRRWSELQAEEMP